MDNKNKRSVLKYIIVTAIAILLIVLLWMVIYRNQNKPQEVSYDTMISQIKNGEVTGIYVQGGYTVYYTTDADLTKFNKNPTTYAKKFAQTPSRTVFSEDVKEIGGVTAKITYDNPSTTNSWTSYIVPVAGLLIMLVMVFFLFRQIGGQNKQAMSFGKTRARLTRNVKIRFTDVAGAEEEKEELKEIVEFLKSPEKFKKLGAKVPKGVLLVGPPGTGKTLFAKAVAGESNVNFFSISGSDFVEMFVGTGAARVRDLFDQAQKNRPCIVFIDEIDAVGRQRGAGLGGGNDEREQTLNQLLVQMDGFEESTDIIVMAATNRADVLDPALLRPGRFDRQIYVHMPDVKGREEILKVHSRNKPLAPDVTFKVVARMTTGFSGADLANLLNEAAILAARNNRSAIVMEDILEGINKVIAGPQKKSRVVTDSDKRITAYHESGHAIVAKLLPNCDEVQEVSIIPRGQAAGYTLTRPETDDSHVTKNKLNDTIAMMLGGRAAEDIVIKDISTGASNDIERASGMARKMVVEWGMSDAIGNMFLGADKEVFLGKDYGTAHNYSEVMAAKIDTEIKAIIDKNYEIAKNLLSNNRKILDNMVKVLYEKETIYTEDVDALFEGKSAKEVIEAIDAREAAKEKYKKENNEINPKIEIVEEKDLFNDPIEPVTTVDNKDDAKNEE
ncbi:MAG: ATP-dependent zinc metalloprotease FtsH [Clostridia bacterium]|nr:ATP-dependent zinc metalloprotease FtsH [Clostridia bacterium]